MPATQAGSSTCSCEWLCNQLLSSLCHVTPVSGPLIFPIPCTDTVQNSEKSWPFFPKGELWAGEEHGGPSGVETAVRFIARLRTGCKLPLWECTSLAADSCCLCRTQLKMHPLPEAFVSHISPMPVLYQNWS